MPCIEKLGLPVVGVTARGVENSVKPLARAVQGGAGVRDPGGGGGRVGEAVGASQQRGSRGLPKLPLHPVRQLLSLQIRQSKTRALTVRRGCRPTRNAAW